MKISIVFYVLLCFLPSPFPVFLSLFRYLVPDRNITIHLRNPNPELFHFEDIWVYAIDKEESGTSAGGRMCQHISGQMTSSAGVQLHMVFTCPRRISVNVNCVAVKPNISLDACEMYAKFSHNW